MKIDHIIIERPHPPKVLHPNARAHWRDKSAATKRYRADTKAVAMAILGYSRPPRWERANVQCTFHFRRRRNRDRDNLLGWMKAAFDGIADAGIVANDCGMIHHPIEIVDQALDECVVIRMWGDG